MLKKIIKFNTLLMIFPLLMSLNVMAQMELSDEIKHEFFRKKAGSKALSGRDICGIKILEFGPVKKNNNGYYSDYYANSVERLYLYKYLEKKATERECDEAIKKVKSMGLKGEKRKHGTVRWK